MGTVNLLIGMDFYGLVNKHDKFLELQEQILGAKIKELLPDEHKNLRKYNLQSKITNFQCIGPVFDMKGFENQIILAQNDKTYDKFHKMQFLTGKKFVPSFFYDNPVGKTSQVENLLKKFSFVAEMGNLHPEYYVNDVDVRRELYNHVPQGTSFETVMHFSKLIKENRLAPYTDIRLVYKNRDSGKVDLK